MIINAIFSKKNKTILLIVLILKEITLIPLSINKWNKFTAIYEYADSLSSFRITFCIQ